MLGTIFIAEDIDNIFSSRQNASLTTVILLNVDAAMSTGCVVRAISIDAAIMLPRVSSPFMTKNAPTVNANELDKNLYCLIEF